MRGIDVALALAALVTGILAKFGGELRTTVESSGKKKITTQGWVTAACLLVTCVLGITKAFLPPSAGANASLEHAKLETSADPRKELANLGIPWSTESFVEALMTSDARSVQLFLAGGMAATTSHNGAAAVLYVFQPNLPDPVPMLQLLVSNGYNLDANLIDTRILAHYSDLLPPHFEAPGLPAEYSAWNRTFAGPALLWVVIRSSASGATSSDRHVIQFMLQHGADPKLSRRFLRAMAPAWGDTASYKEVRRLIE